MTGADSPGGAGGEALFWDLAGELIAAGRAEEGRIMSSRCVRVNGDFLAMCERKTGALVVKVGESAARSLIDAGEGRPFAPAGKAFREWVAVDRVDEQRWRQLLDEGVAFVGGT